MSQKNTNQPEYGTELKLAAVRRVLAGRSSAFDGNGCMCGRTVMQSWAKPAWRIGEEEGRER
jgi:hypothetical protein